MTISRRVHRWVAAFFLLTVAGYLIAMTAGGQQAVPMWLTYLPLAPLFVLMGTGLVLLVGPLLRRRR